MRPNVLLITFDTTSAGHIGHLGGAARTPHLDRLAGQGTAFTRAFSTSSWTAPSHGSLFTGLHPSQHGLHRTLGEDEDTTRMDDDHTTLADVLRDHGWATAGYSGGPFVSEQYGLARGFDVFDEAPEPRNAEELNRLAVPWLAELDDDQPFFLFLNYFDPHGPYQPHRSIATDPVDPNDDWWAFSPGRYKREARTMPSGEALERVIQRYDDEIHQADLALGQMLHFIESIDRLDSTLIVVTADHGESFGDELLAQPHWGHGAIPFASQTWVPLVVRPPGGSAPRRVDRIVSNVDVGRTILDFVQIQAEWPGFDLLDEPSTEGIAIAERYQHGRHVATAWWRQHELISFDELEGRALRHVVHGGDSQPDIWIEGTSTTAPWRELFAQRTAEYERRELELDPAALVDGTGIEIHPDREEQLRALGYIE